MWEYVKPIPFTISPCIRSCSLYFLKTNNSIKVNLLIYSKNSVTRKEDILIFNKGELNHHKFDGLMSAAERLCLSVLPKGTDPVVAHSLLKEPFWQEVIDEIMIDQILDE
jgi:hypothetical protein